MALTSPAQVELLLDDYARSPGAVPPQANQRREWNVLPHELRVFAAQALADGFVCAFWTDGADTWAFAASLAPERSRAAGRPVLEVHRIEPGESSRSREFVTRLTDGSWVRDPS